jgi:hypothetical protein
VADDKSPIDSSLEAVQTQCTTIGRAEMKRLVSLLVLTVGIAAVVAVPTLAFAESDRDPNDVESPLDLRRISARFRFRGHAQLSMVIAFYPDYRPSAIPRRRDAVQNEWDLFVRMAPNFQGFFFRRGRGEIVFIYGDFRSGSKCCFEATVRQPGSDALKVVVRHLPTSRFRVRADTWWPENGVIHDRTGVLLLGRPPS